jgi:hypothetical protein
LIQPTGVGGLSTSIMGYANSTSEGVAMRKYWLTTLVLLLVIALGLGAVACGSGSASSKNPQELLTASVDAGKATNSASGSYQIDINLNADSTAGSSGAAALGQTFKITGTFASQTDPALVDLTGGLDLMGTTMGAGARVIDTSMWLNVLGQWYEVPADQLQQTTDTSNAANVQAVKDAIDEQGIDFTTWFKDLKVVPGETPADADLTHLTSAVDVQKMAADVVALLQSPKLATLMSSAGATAGAETGVTVPDAAGLQQYQATVEQMIQSATIDMWIANADYSMRKLVLTAKVTIPPELGTTGLSGLDLVFTIDLDAPGTAISVKAPESAKPFADLQTDLASNPLLSGLGSLLGGSSSGLGGLLGQ